jgi:drug/metabolite transporter (DMT)-like permease
MDFSMISQVLLKLSSWIQPYIYEVAMTIVATLLVVYGDVLNKKIKRLLSTYHFIIRTFVFVLICAFGYGALIVLSTPHIKDLIMLVPVTYRGLSIFLAFLLLGYLAENRRYI